MFEMQMLRAFITDRLSAVAEDIFEAVQRTVMSQYEQEVQRVKTELFSPLNSFLEACGPVQEPDSSQALSSFEELNPDEPQYTFQELGKWPPEDPINAPSVKNKESWMSQEEQQERRQRQHSPQNALFTSSENFNSHKHIQTPLHRLLKQSPPCQAQAVEYDRGSQLPANSTGLPRPGSESSEVVPAVSNGKPPSSGCPIAEPTSPEFGKRITTQTKTPLERKSVQKVDSQYTPLPVDLRSKKNVDRPFRCNVCDKAFTQKRYLSCHMNIHTHEKFYVCHFCGKRYVSSTQLNSHIRLHTGETPFYCGVCGRSFRMEAMLRRHMWAHRRVKAVLQETNQVGAFPTVSLEALRKMQCGELENHLRTGQGDVAWSMQTGEQKKRGSYSEEDDLMGTSHLPQMEILENEGGEGSPSSTTDQMEVKPEEATIVNGLVLYCR